MAEPFQVFDPADALTAISILFATLLGILTLWQSRRISRRDHTLDILLSRFSGGDIGELLKRVSELIDDSENAPDGTKNIYEVWEVLNLYEFISAAARQGTLDIELIYQTRGGAMLRTFEFFHPYIRKQREIDKNDLLWEHFEWFVDTKIRPRRPK